MTPNRQAGDSHASRQSAVGDQFGKYTLLAKLATGGMAELFVARLRGAGGFRKKVVIKRIHPHVAFDENFTRMFLDEAKTCAMITHPNVCQVFELCESTGTHYLVLEYLEGATFGEFVRRHTQSQTSIAMPLAVGLLAQVCDGLHAAHEQIDDAGKGMGLVHRDVSPGNLFITVDGIVKLLDFGIAKARWMSRRTKTGTLLGKCEYMSPEQARGGQALDRRSDIFSLGVCAWEMLCGRRLFRRENEYETLRAVLRAPVEPPSAINPDVPEMLDKAIMKALERDRDMRYDSAYEFRRALSDAIAPLGGPTAMGEIASVVRTAFAGDLDRQRSILRRASAHATSIKHNPLLPPPLPEMPALNAANASSARRAPLERETRLKQGGRRSTLGLGTAPPPLASATALAGPKEIASTVDLRTGECTSVVSSESFHVLADASENFGGGDLALYGAAKPGAVGLPPPFPASERPHTTIETGLPLPPNLPLQPSTRAREISKARDRHSNGGAVQVSVAAQGQPQAAAQPKGSPPTFEISRLAGRWHTDAKLVRYGSVAAASLVSFALVLFAWAPWTSNSSARVGAPSGAVAGATSETTEDTLGATSAPAAVPGDFSLPQGTAVVTSIGESQDVPPATVGQLTIHSSRRAEVLLYPNKVSLGYTPLGNIELPAGRHKLKIIVGPRKSERKYFNIDIEAGETLERHLYSWPDSPDEPDRYF